MRMENLRQLREKADLTRDELANLSGVLSTTIRNHELGLVKGTSEATEQALAKALNVPVQALFFASNMEISIIQEANV